MVNDGGNGVGSDHASWGDAKLHYANNESEEVNLAVEELKNAVSVLEIKVNLDEVVNIPDNYLAQSMTCLIINK